jgi:hypothetical protein
VNRSAVSGTGSVSAFALGATALGALAVGAAAIGALAIGVLSIRNCVYWKAGSRIFRFGD